MSVVVVVLLMWFAALVGFVLGAWWHARPSMDEAYPVERRRAPARAYPSALERRRMAR